MPSTLRTGEVVTAQPSDGTGSRGGDITLEEILSRGGIWAA